MGNHKHNYGIGSERMSPATEPHGRDERDIEILIHHLEAEAYHAVLKAFSAQSDNLTWAREALMTELRKELNITDDEHGELLLKIKLDESVKLIREWRNDTHRAQECGKGAPRYPPKVVSNAQTRKVETSLPPVSKSQKCASCSQPCTEIIPSAAPDAQTKDVGGMTVKRGRTLTQGNSLVVNLKYQGQHSNYQRSGDLEMLSNQYQRQHSNDRKSGDLAMLSSENGRQPMNISCHNPQAPSSSRSTELVKSQLKMGFQVAGSDNLKKSCDWIKIRATGQVIHQVEKLISQERVVPLHVEKAKLLLREQERAILEALGKLPDVTDVDDSPKQMQHKYSHEELPGMGGKMLIHNDFYRHAGRLTY